MKALIYGLAVALLSLVCGLARAEITVFGKIADTEANSAWDAAEIQAQELNAVKSRESTLSVLGSTRFKLDGAEYVLISSYFMAKTHPNEVCTPAKNYREYTCQEGQPDVNGCHLMFFNAKGQSVGFHTMQIKERFPTSCSIVRAVGVANKADNTLLVTMGYSMPYEQPREQRIKELRLNSYEMTSLFKVKAVNGKIEVEQDDTCLGNPNKIDNIAFARTALDVCKDKGKLSEAQLKTEVERRHQIASDLKEEAARQKTPAKYRPWIAAGYQLFSQYVYDLNGDGIQDAILILETMDKGSRRLIVLNGVTPTTFVKTGESDAVAFCEGCGSIRTSEDPFKEVVPQKNRFAVVNSVQGGAHWTFQFEFAWSRIDKQWQLVEVQSSNAELGDNGLVSSDCTYKPPKDFGKISLEAFNLDFDKFLTASAKKKKC